jgi:hypothetical protein
MVKKTRDSTQNGLQAKMSKSLTPLFVKSSQPEVNDQVIAISHMVDDDIAMHPVTPEYKRSIDGSYGDFMPLPLMVAQRQLFPSTVAKPEKCFASSSIACMPMMPSDEEVLMPTPHSLLFLPAMQECARPTVSLEATTTFKAAMQDTNDNSFGGVLSRMLLADVSDPKNVLPPEENSSALQGFNKNARKDVDSWDKYFNVAKEFRKLHGHCCIPYKYPQDRKFVSSCEKIFYCFLVKHAVLTVFFCFVLFHLSKRRLGQSDSDTSIPCTNVSKRRSGNLTIRRLP